MVLKPGLNHTIWSNWVNQKPSIKIVLLTLKIDVCKKISEPCEPRLNLLFLKTVDGFCGFNLGLFFLPFLVSYRLSHCWIFILQLQTFKLHHHFFLFFILVSLAHSLSLSWFLLTVVFAFFFLYIISDCSFGIFLSPCILF